MRPGFAVTARGVAAKPSHICCSSSSPHTSRSIDDVMRLSSIQSRWGTFWLFSCQPLHIICRHGWRSSCSEINSSDISACMHHSRLGQRIKLETNDMAVRHAGDEVAVTPARSGSFGQLIGTAAVRDAPIVPDAMRAPQRYFFLFHHRGRGIQTQRRALLATHLPFTYSELRGPTTYHTISHR